MKTHTYIIVPAAGEGTRMQQNMPKQYLELAGKAVLEHTLNALLAIPHIQHIVVALAPDDVFFEHLSASRHPRVMRVNGGTSRAASVLNALNALRTEAQAHDWILVHDAARPLVRQEDIHQLRTTLADHPVGGILASPVTDTLKRVGADLQIQQTLERDTLWRALTPQMCRYDLLKSALTTCLSKNIPVTDEAMALEYGGLNLQIVEGASDNIKITYPIDLLLAEQILANRAHVKPN